MVYVWKSHYDGHISQLLKKLGSEEKLRTNNKLIIDIGEYKVKPYTLDVKSNWVFPKFEICFEDTPIREVSGMSRKDVQDFVNLLNTAYTLGYSSGEIVGRLEGDN